MYQNASIRFDFNNYLIGPYKNASDTVRCDDQAITTVQKRWSVRLDFKTQLSDPYKILNSTVIY